MKALRILWFAMLFPLVTFLSSCQDAGPPSGKNIPAGKGVGKIRVLTTIAPLYSFAVNVAGNSATVENLLPTGAGPHEYAMSPEDVRKISGAQVIIINGAGLETWLDKVTVGGDRIVADASAGIPVIDNNPHIWLSPMNAVTQVRNIRDTLVRADPVNAELYRKNADDYIKRLEDLDGDIRRTASSFSKKDLVSMHSAFLYFARDYGLHQAAVIEPFSGKEPTPGHIADVIRVITSRGIRVIFSEPRISAAIVETLARDLDLTVYSLDPLETGELSREGYETGMRRNLETLKTAMGQ